MQSPQRFAQVFNKKHPAPEGPKELAHHELHGNIVEDNYKALEKDNEKSRDWLAAQKDRLDTFTSQNPHHGEHRDIMAQAFNHPSEGAPIYAGGKYFSTYSDGESQKSVVHVRDSLDGEPRVLLDPRIYDEEDKPYNGIISSIMPNGDGSMCIVLFSNSGTANSFGAVYDVENGEMIEELVSTSMIKWASGKNDAIIYLAGHEDEEHWCLQEHTIGDDLANDRTSFEFVPKERKGYTKHRSIGADKGRASHEFLMLHTGTQRDNGIFARAAGSTDAFDQLFDDGKSCAEPIAEVGGKLLMLTDLDAPMSRVVAVDYDNPAPENWQTVIAENPERDIESVSFVKGKLFVNYLENAQSKVAVHEPSGEHLQDMPLPDGCSAYVRSLGPKEDRLLVRTDSFTHPMKKHFYDVAKNEMTAWDDSPSHPELSDDFVVEHLSADSKDGTKVPMTIIRHKDVELDGSAATILNGYGGFDIPMTPGFHENMQHFLEQGGVYVQANLRGGGEFGAEWYDEGRLGNKQNVFDDFAACGKALINEGYTKPERLAIHGASNGGLLVLATALQNPDLFGAVIAHAPVADLLDKKTWPSDYGRPRNSQQDFDAAIEYSPLQNIEEGQKYPAMLVCTADHDDIVPQRQGHKFVATMNEKSPETLCLLLQEEDAGHYAGSLKTRDQLLDYHTKMYDFVEQSLGPIDQKQYKEAAANWEEAKPRSAKLPKGKDGVKNWRKDLEESRRIKGEQTEVGIRI